MHARFEGNAVPLEGLQTTANSAVLLQNGNDETLFGEQCSGHESA